MEIENLFEIAKKTKTCLLFSNKIFPEEIQLILQKENIEVKDVNYILFIPYHDNNSITNTVYSTFFNECLFIQTNMFELYINN